MASPSSDIVASLAVSGVASLAVTGAASLANLAGGVTIGAASLAVAGVASLADAGAASLAVSGVASLAVAGVAPPAVAGVASLANFAEVVPSGDIAGSVAVGVTLVADPVSVITEEMTFWDGHGAMDCSVCDCVGCCDGNLGSRSVPGRCWGGVPGRPCWGVTIGMASLAVAGAASLADAGVASLANLAEGVTGGLASPAIAGVAFLAVFGVAPLADFAEVGKCLKQTRKLECQPVRTVSVSWCGTGRHCSTPPARYGGIASQFAVSSNVGWIDLTETVSSDDIYVH